MLFFNLLAGLVIFATLMALIPRNQWWFRSFDFPRLQILTLAVIAVLGLLCSMQHWSLLQVLIVVLLLGCSLYQCKMILPYTPVWPKQVRQHRGQHDLTRQISLLVSNVLTPNPNKTALIELVQQHQPDILITLESDAAWEQALNVLETDYPHVVRVPLDNLYGMHLYSRLPLIEPEVKFLLSPEIPSIHTQVRLRCGKLIWLYCLHPKPPSPTEAKDSTLRDAELLMVGDHIEQYQHTCIVAGDLNDVAWSRTTRLFQRISGLLDPRVGRYFMNTFHVNYSVLRWSLDHVFHSTDFSLIDMQRMPNIGSDHFPVLTRLHYDPALDAVQDELASTDADQQEAAERIEQGIEQAQVRHPQHQADFL